MLSVCNVKGVTDAGLAHLAEARGLRKVLLSGSAVTPRGVEKLKESRPDLDVQWRGE